MLCRLYTQPLCALLIILLSPLSQGESLSSAEECKARGANVFTGMCCMRIAEFSITQGVGACGCAPHWSREATLCRCPEGQEPQAGRCRASGYLVDGKALTTISGDEKARSSDCITRPKTNPLLPEETYCVVEENSDEIPLVHQKEYLHYEDAYYLIKTTRYTYPPCKPRFSEGGKYLMLCTAAEGHAGFTIYQADDYLTQLKPEIIGGFEDAELEWIERFTDDGWVLYSVSTYHEDMSKNTTCIKEYRMPNTQQVGEAESDFSSMDKDSYKCR